MPALAEVIFKFLAESLEGRPEDPKPPLLISDLDSIVSELTRFSSGTDGNGLTEWLKTLDAIGSSDLRETILVRALQIRMPRLSELLTLAGIIEFHFDDEATEPDHFSLNWAKLESFLRSPGPTAIATLIGKLPNRDNVQIAQVLIGQLLTVPRELMKHEYARQGFASMPVAQASDFVDLEELLGLIESPLHLGLPAPWPPPGDSDNAKEWFKEAARQDPVPPPSLSIHGEFGADPPDDRAGALDGKLGLELMLDDVQSRLSEPLALEAGGLPFRLSARSPDTGSKAYRLFLNSSGAMDREKASDGMLDLAVEAGMPGKVLVIGPPEGTHIECGMVRLSIRLSKPSATSPPGPADTRPPPIFQLCGTMQNMALAISPEALGLLGKLVDLPAGGIAVRGDISLAWANGAGLQGGQPDGAFAIAATYALPLNLSAGSGSARLHLDGASLGLSLDVDAVGETLRSRIDVAFSARARFGPVEVQADGLGGSFGEDGVKALPLSGFGISLSAGVLAGGGRLQKVGDDYAGALSIRMLGVGVNAYGLFGRAGNSPSFLAILGISLPVPGVQLGFGFALNGVGGLFAINRAADIDVLRTEMASGASADILFCTDPIGRAGNLVALLPRLFPARAGTVLVGPTLRLDWARLAFLDVGVFIELPGPSKVMIAGSARLVVGPPPVSLIYLRCDIFGAIDFVRREISIDAILVDSHILQLFRVTGGFALRVGYGEPGHFLLSVGGFHPDFRSPGLDLPRLPRVGTASQMPLAWLRLEAYVALTPASFQVGARIEAGLKLGPISAHGWLGFDAIAQFEPFAFTATIDAGVSVEVFGFDFCNVRLRGQLTGPGPLVLRAQASVKVMGARVSESVTVSFGTQRQPKQVVTQQTVLEAVADEFRKAENVRSLGGDPAVVLRSDAAQMADDAPIVSPAMPIVWEQRRVPFDLPLHRFDGLEIADQSGAPLTLSHALGGVVAGDEMERFPAGAYVALGEAEALSAGQFHEQKSGIRLSGGAPRTGAHQAADLNAKLIMLPPIHALGKFTSVAFLEGPLLSMVREMQDGPRPIKVEPTIAIAPERWAVRDKDNGAAVTGDQSQLQALLAARNDSHYAVRTGAMTASMAGVFLQ